MSIVSCPNCGHPNADSAKFCAKCGNKLSAAETVVMGVGDTGTSMSPPPPAPARPSPTPISAKEQAAFGPPPAQPAPPPGYSPPAYSPATPPPAAPYPAAAPGEGGHRYVAMRTIAGLCNALAWISLGLAVLGGIIWVFVAGFGFLSLLTGLVGGAIAGALGWIYWRLLGEGIWLALDIESNTRRAAVALENQRQS